MADVRRIMEQEFGLSEDPIERELGLAADPAARQQQLFAEGGALLRELLRRRREVDQEARRAGATSVLDPEYWRGMGRAVMETPERVGGEILAGLGGEKYSPAGPGTAGLARDIGAVFGGMETNIPRGTGDLEEYFLSRELGSQFDPSLSEGEKAQIGGAAFIGEVAALGPLGGAAREAPTTLGRIGGVRTGQQVTRRGAGPAMGSISFSTRKGTATATLDPEGIQRMYQGMTQKQLAKELNIPVKELKQWLKDNGITKKGIRGMSIKEEAPIQGKVDNPYIRRLGPAEPGAEPVRRARVDVRAIGEEGSLGNQVLDRMMEQEPTDVAEYAAPWSMPGGGTYTPGIPGMRAPKVTLDPVHEEALARSMGWEYQPGKVLEKTARHEIGHDVARRIAGASRQGSQVQQAWEKWGEARNLLETHSRMEPVLRVVREAPPRHTTLPDKEVVRWARRLQRTMRRRFAGREGEELLGPSMDDFLDAYHQLDTYADGVRDLHLNWKNLYPRERADRLWDLNEVRDSALRILRGIYREADESAKGGLDRWEIFRKSSLDRTTQTRLAQMKSAKISVELQDLKDRIMANPDGAQRLEEARRLYEWAEDMYPRIVEEAGEGFGEGPTARIFTEPYKQVAFKLQEYPDEVAYLALERRQIPLQQRIEALNRAVDEAEVLDALYRMGTLEWDRARRPHQPGFIEETVADIVMKLSERGPDALRTKEARKIYDEVFGTSRQIKGEAGLREALFGR